MNCKPSASGRLMAATMLTWLCSPAFALRNDPSATEPGDRGSIVFPLDNDPESDGPLE